jgi:hypothetical protein
MPDDRSACELVVLSDEAARRVDNYRFGKRIDSESEALRRLINIGLDHAEEGIGDRQHSLGR